MNVKTNQVCRLQKIKTFFLFNYEQFLQSVNAQ